MDAEAAWIQCCLRIRAGETAAAEALLAAHPEIGSQPAWCAILFEQAVKIDCPAALAMLVRQGLDVNFPQVVGLPSRPLWYAAVRNNLAALRWLLSHGAEINYPPVVGKTPSCHPLPFAIMEGHFEAVRLLVEAGALLDVSDNLGETPLDCALRNGHQEIADYLRSRGGRTARELPSWRPPPMRHPVVEAVERLVPCDSCPVPWDSESNRASPVTVHAVFDAEFNGLFTAGMSDRALAVSPEAQAYRYAELVLHLGDWGDDPDAWQASEQAWVIRWVRRLTQMPFEDNGQLVGQWTIISNGDKPKPLSKYTKTTCWLLLGEKVPLERVELPDGRSVCFYTLMPIHTAERDLAITQGLGALLQRFADHDVPTWLDPQRTSVV